MNILQAIATDTFITCKGMATLRHYDHKLTVHAECGWYIYHYPWCQTPLKLALTCAQTPYPTLESCIEIGPGNEIKHFSSMLELGPQ